MERQVFWDNNPKENAEATTSTVAASFSNNQ